SWAADAPRRAAAAVPEAISFQTKPQIASTLLRRVRAQGLVSFDWVIADEFYGHNGDFLDDLEAQQQRYVIEVPATTTVWTVDPQSQVPPHQGRRGPVATLPPRERVRQHVRSVRALAQSLPANAWQVLQVRAGAKGPLAFAFARLRV